MKSDEVILILYKNFKLTGNRYCLKRILLAFTRLNKKVRTKSEQRKNSTNETGNDDFCLG